MGKSKNSDSSSKSRVVATNRKALFDYHVEEKIEAGLVLVGTEVKALREGHLNLRDSYATVNDTKAVLHNCHIGSYSHGNQMNHEPLRPRTLLLHKKELARLMGKVKQKGLTLIPLRLYFNDRGRAKLELALARGKKTYDRRETIKKREATREIDRAMKASRNK